MEIFNEILKINDIEIIIIYDKKNINKYNELKVPRYTSVPLNMQQTTKFINEPVCINYYQYLKNQLHVFHGKIYCGYCQKYKLLICS